MKQKNVTYLLLGTNMGDRFEHLRQARYYLRQSVGQIIDQSSIYASQAWGDRDQPDFYNQVLSLTTLLSAEELLRKILEIESDMGRIRERQWSSRIIDIDILFFNHDLVCKADLVVPHPRMAERNFTLVPLMEIAPEFLHPVMGATIEELYLHCTDTLEVLMIEN